MVSKGLKQRYHIETKQIQIETFESARSSVFGEREFPARGGVVAWWRGGVALVERA